MKPSLLTVQRAILMAGLAGVELSVLGQNTNATLAINRDATGASIRVSDSGNRAWSVQASTNFIDWMEVETVQVHNGYFETGSKSFGGANAFYRALFSTGAVSRITAMALNTPVGTFNYANPSLPPNFAVFPILQQDNTPAENPTTDSGAALGRVLFYDKRLSFNQKISCSSCHQQENGFSDPKKFSVGFEGGLTGRNSMGLSNARYYQRRHFFWDERVATLENQVLQPIQNAIEMGMTLPLLRARLAAESYYTNLFANAFGSVEVTDQRISRALAQFVRSIISTQSKFDAGIPVRFSNFTAEENLGRQIFNGQVGRATCVACHGTDNFVPGPNINNNGLENPYIDKGLGGVTGLAQDEGKFKVPSLRNIELTAPYMHDGRFATLEHVVEFYNSGIVNHPNLSPPLRVPSPPGMPPGPPLRLNLTAAEKAALVAFLKTLTDPNLATNPKYTDPFNYGN
jgi:cytochrome c peroxidase